MTKSFEDRVKNSLDISNKLQAEPWLAENLDDDPKVLAAVMAKHADYNTNGMIGGFQPSSVRETLRGLIDARLSERAERAQTNLSRAGFAVSLAGFVLAGVQLAVTFL